MLRTGLNVTDGCLILTRDEKVPLPNKMHKEMLLTINRALFHQQAPVHIRIMNARTNDKGLITTMMHQNATAEMALQYHDIIIMAVSTVD